ncbi:hypothetical protein AB0O01_07840 [Streptomyces sp. NPDC093252]|uniref:hypothetical protein n=1 Tax=Streptomyces sp. NPDC093252 TaxID=3154980 RepID=UPI00344AAE20
MVSSPHDAMHRIFRDDPGLFARLLPRAGIAFPEYYSIDPLDTDLTEIRPMERRVDSLFRVRAASDEGGFLLAVEAQGKKDPDKRNSWTYYLAYLYAKYRLPPVLVVLCRDKQTAVWAMEPIRIGPGFHTSMHVYPMVLGPGNLSAITDPAEVAADVPLAVFAAFAHAKDPGLPAILEALAAGMQASSEADAAPGEGLSIDMWAEYVEIGLGTGSDRDLWRQLMRKYTPNFPGSGTLLEETWLEGRAKGQEEGRVKGRVEGRLEGRTEDILRILAARDIDIPAPVRERIAAGAELDVLDRWFDRALTVTDAEELFVEGDGEQG